MGFEEKFKGIDPMSWAIECLDALHFTQDFAIFFSCSGSNGEKMVAGTVFLPKGLDNVMHVQRKLSQKMVRVKWLELRNQYIYVCVCLCVQYRRS